MKNVILTGDLHLTSNPRDAYRWDLFPWLVEQCLKLGVQRVVVLGDLTDAKDYHPSVLINQVVQALMGLVEAADLRGLTVLRGNHDGLDPAWPYFRFLDELPKVSFIHEPTRAGDELWLPHSRDPKHDWRRYAAILNDGLTVLAHITVDGARAESGTEMQGIDAAFFKHARIVWSGDVHMPQRVGRVNYAGAPYHIRFGDKFEPRVVHLDAKGKPHDLHFPTLRRWMLTPQELDTTKVRAGDQVKVRVELERSEYGLWRERKKEIEAWAKRRSVELIAVELVPVRTRELSRKGKAAKQRSPAAVLDEFCAANKVGDELAATGKELLKT